MTTQRRHKVVMFALAALAVVAVLTFVLMHSGSNSGGDITTPFTTTTK